MLRLVDDEGSLVFVSHEAVREATVEWLRTRPGDVYLWVTSGWDLEVALFWFIAGFEPDLARVWSGALKDMPYSVYPEAEAFWWWPEMARAVLARQCVEAGFEPDEYSPEAVLHWEPVRLRAWVDRGFAVAEATEWRYALGAWPSGLAWYVAALGWASRDLMAMREALQGAPGTGEQAAELTLPVDQRLEPLARLACAWVMVSSSPIVVLSCLAMGMSIAEAQRLTEDERLAIEVLGVLGRDG